APARRQCPPLGRPPPPPPRAAPPAPRSSPRRSETPEGARRPAGTRPTPGSPRPGRRREDPATAMPASPPPTNISGRRHRPRSARAHHTGAQLCYVRTGEPGREGVVVLATQRELCVAADAVPALAFGGVERDVGAGQKRVQAAGVGDDRDA